MLPSTGLFVMSLGLVSLSLAQVAPAPQFSTVFQPEALTPQSAFSSRVNPVNVLRGNFPEDNLRQIALGSQQFGLDLLHRISSISDLAKPEHKDFMISPFSVWSLLLLLYEGASGDTYTQLQRALRITVNDETLRSVYRVWSQYLNVNTSTIEVASLQALYTDMNSPLTNEYREALQNYNVQPKVVDFYDRNTAQLINEATNRSTRGLIPYTVLPQEIKAAKMFMLSSLYFKGQWKLPFNASATRWENFNTEEGSVVTVPMMVQEANFAYVTNIEGLDAYVLELPYGTQDRLSMIILLPKKGFRLHDVTASLKNLGLAPIIERLARFKREAAEDNEVEVIMPKFTTVTDFKLNGILGLMGIKDLFDEKKANLARMGQGLYANLCVHSTKIIVDEKGTTAAASTSASLINKSTPPKFHLNRPFQYLIVDKSTSLLLFAGEVRNLMSKT